MKRLLAVKRLFALLSAFSLVACLDVSGPGPSNPATETFAATLGLGNLNDTTIWKQTTNGTYYREDVLGTGSLLFLDDYNDSIFVDYTGWLKSGAQFGTGTSVGFPAGGVIPGFLDGMVGMRAGGTRTIVVPSNLGYGNTTSGQIPANATLIFRIKLNTFTGA